MSSPGVPSAAKRANSPNSPKWNSVLLVTVLTVALSSFLLIVYLWNTGRPAPRSFRPQHMCICPMIYMPVCDVNGTTLSSACQATCLGLEIKHEGECEPRIPLHCNEGCPDTFTPVCGINKLTYLNPCVAECSGVEVLKKGVCSSTMIIKPKPEPEQGSLAGR